MMNYYLSIIDNNKFNMLMEQISHKYIRED